MTAVGLLFAAGLLAGAILTMAVRLALLLWRNRSGRLLLRVQACESRVAEMQDQVDTFTLRAGMKYGGDDE